MVLYFEKPEVKKGFTLIELLAVITIIAMLLAFLIPALNKAKLRAKQVVCSSRMKQWTLATLAYTVENNSAIPPFADTCDATNYQNALNPETYYYNRLSPYLTNEYNGKWGMDYGNRRCPMGRKDWGEKAVWIGVYFSQFDPSRAPFIYLNRWDGKTLTKKSDPFKTTSIRLPVNYLMMLDAKRDQVFEPIRHYWNKDYDGDGMNDSNGDILNDTNLGPYNFAQPKIHLGGCNISLFDGHTEWIRYETFWECASDGYPAHRYWYNQNRP